MMRTLGKKKVTIAVIAILLIVCCVSWVNSCIKAQEEKIKQEKFEKKVDAAVEAAELLYEMHKGSKGTK